MRNHKLVKLIASRDSPFQLVLACGVGLLLGVACLWFSPLWVLGALTVGGLGFATLKRPEIALLAILVATSSIVFEDRLPLIPIGIGSLQIPDILLLGLLGLIALRWLVEPDFKIIRTPLDLPLLAFYGMALLSTFTAIGQSSVETHLAIRAIRVVTYYLTFFIVTNLVRDSRQLTTLLKGLHLLAAITAAAMIAQFVLGEAVSLLPGRVETLWIQGRAYSGVFRILPPGQSLILVAFIATTATLVSNRFGPMSMLRFLHWSLLGLVVVLTFNRSFWVQTTLALFLLGCLVGRRNRQSLIAWGLVAAVLGAVVLFLALQKPGSQAAGLVGAFFGRLGTLGERGTLREGSLQFRYIENEYALSQIRSHPLIGLGFGARYRPRDTRLDWGEEWDAEAYIHNGHLWILLKSGPLGYLCLLWLSLAFLIRGFKHWRRVRDGQMKATVLGFTLTYLGVLIGAFVNPMFMQRFWTPVIGIMMGVNEVVLMKVVQDGSAG